MLSKINMMNKIQKISNVSGIKLKCSLGYHNCHRSSGVELIRPEALLQQSNLQ
jgi:hypothetical protein